MTTTTTTICDYCRKDLTWTNNCTDYRILLTSEEIPSVGGFMTAMAMYPEIKKRMHFCSRSCLVSALNSYLDQEL